MQSFEKVFFLKPDDIVLCVVYLLTAYVFIRLINQLYSELGIDNLHTDRKLQMNSRSSQKVQMKCLVSLYGEQEHAQYMPCCLAPWWCERKE